MLNDPKILFNYELGIRPTATFDLAQDAKTFGFKAFLAPGLAIGKFILAQENDVFAGPAKGGWLLVYPDLRLVSEAMYASDAGSNVAIRDDDMYVGLGIQPILEFSLNVGNALDRLRLSAKYRFMSVFSAVIDKTERYELNARYDFDRDGIANINLNYTDGENADTIQDERYWSVKFGLKF